MSQNHSGRNLQGRSFQGRNLEGEDFSDTDIRGTNFNNANLRGANFNGAKAGLPLSRTIGLLLIALFLAIASGFLSGITGAMEIAALEAGKLTAISASYIILIALPIFAFFAIRQSLETAFKAACGTVALAMVLPVMLAWLGLIRGTLTSATTGILPGTMVAGGLIAGAGVFAVAIALAGLVSSAAALLVAATGLLFILASMAGALGFLGAAVMADSKTSLDDLTFGYASGTRTVPELDIAIEAIKGSVGIAALAILVGSSIVAGLGLYLGWRISVGDERYAILRQVAVAFAATGGTNFQGADLTDAAFKQATLKSTDLRKAILTRTNWLQAQKLSFARLDNTYLSDSLIRNLVTTGQGANQKFDRQNLQGVNLEYANLVNASFINTDLSKADLRYADLSRASLVRAQLEDTKLAGASLTGACIENWSITQNTDFKGVVCDFIYLHHQISQDSDSQPSFCDRVPHEGQFKKNQFFEFIQTFLNAVDLEHEERFNTKATVLALIELSEECQEILNVISLEQRGRNILIKVQLPSSIERNSFTEKYYSKYKEFKNTSYKSSRDRQYLENHVEQLEKLIEKLRSTPRAVNIEYFYNEQGVVITGGEFKDTFIQNVGMPIGEARSIQRLNREISTALEKLADTSKESQQYKDLLRNFQNAIKDEIYFNLTDQSDSLEKILVLVKAWNNEQDPYRQNAREAIAYLKGMRVEFPQATTFCEACNNFLPEIDRIIGNKY